MKIAIQLYTIREFYGSIEEFSKAVKKLSDIGYRYVETAGLANLDPQQFKKIMDDNGLKICSSHTGLDRILKEPEAIASEQTKLNALCCNISWPGSQSHDIDAIKKIAEKIERAASTLKAHGITLGYHNHGIEFAKCDGKTWLEIIMEGSSESTLTAQIDTYWVQYGGGDPAQWITNYAKRLNSIHFKDMGMSPDNKQAMVPVGTGNLNWQKILPAAKKSSAKYAIMEMDFSPLYPLWDAIKISFENMKNWGLESE
ncbi:MAG: sugar phosphate isomerase/epimerase [Candidatus Omnitrophica bacterium]|nr:sugar phosphate isomerase/epimerase [Candidatus Omnitrophota bacterium]MCM8827926.1 sugar phosphate isomerase/epimerase [Candidatus Omnitrophota bacterium]